MNLTLKTWAAALALLASACAHKGSSVAQEAAPEPAAPAPAAEVASTPAPPTPARCATDSDCRPSELCVAATCQAITPELAECAAAVAHFSYDRYTLEESDLPALQRQARCLAAATRLSVTVAGHADERGTTMYNIALGTRRATAVQTYLVSLGAAAGQVKTVSYGEERPMCVEHDEGCWAQNRRARVERRF